MKNDRCLYTFLKNINFLQNESVHLYVTCLLTMWIYSCKLIWTWATCPSKGAKQQAIEIVPKLREQIPLSRAEMRFRIVAPIKESKKLMNSLKKINLTKEKEEKLDDNIVLTCLVDPGEYRGLDEIVKNETHGRGQLELLNLKEVEDSEQQLGM